MTSSTSRYLTDDELAAIGASQGAPCQVPLPTVAEEDLDELTRAAGRGMRSLAVRSEDEGQDFIDLVETVLRSCATPPRVVVFARRPDKPSGDLLYLSLFRTPGETLVHLPSATGTHRFGQVSPSEMHDVIQEVVQNAFDTGAATVTVASLQASLDLHAGEQVPDGLARLLEDALSTAPG